MPSFFSSPDTSLEIAAGKTYVTLYDSREPPSPADMKWPCGLGHIDLKGGTVWVMVIPGFDEALGHLLHPPF